MNIERFNRRTLQQMKKLVFDDNTTLPIRLFSSYKETPGLLCLIDFEWSNYMFFLDNVASLDDLIEGLALISPFADDALSRAESMSLRDFADFKLALPTERRAITEGFPSKMPPQFAVLLLPERMMWAIQIAEKFRTSLTVAAIRLWEVGNEMKQEKRLIQV